MTGICNWQLQIRPSFPGIIDIDILGSIVVSIPACHAGDRGSIPRRGEGLFFFLSFLFVSF